MAASGADKYAHLLAPLRDLASNWNIDVARELEDYLGALQTLEVRARGENARVRARLASPHTRAPASAASRRSHSTAARRA